MASFKDARFEFQHNTLGQLTGLAREDDIVNFRGMPYATIPARFHQSRVLEKLPSEPFEALLPGPICPQANLPFPQYWDDDAPDDIPKFPPITQDEFNCLNLSIAAPRQALDEPHRKLLPILVYIHGGAFIGGSQTVRVGGREIYDGTNLVRSSIKLGRPIIVVTINYRVGALSFLASSDLAAFNKSHNEAVGNYGLHDQRQAFLWINKFIGGFGGDPENVTIYGTSAGAASCHYQSLFTERRFRRAILSSATLFGLGPMPVEKHQDLFEQFREALVPSGCDSVKQLQEIPVQQFVKAVPLASCHPLLDGEWVWEQNLHGVSYDPSPPDLMIGACDYQRELIEGALASDGDKPSAIAHWISNILSNGILKHYSSIFPAILTAYGICDHRPSHDPTQEDIAAWTALIADTIFRIPYVYTARTNKSIGKVLLFECKATNPYPHPAGESNSWYGRAHHGIMDLFVFNPAEDKVPPEHLEEYRGTVRRVQQCVVDFCYVDLPWPVYQGGAGQAGEKEMVYVFENGDGSRLVRGLEEAVGRDVASRWEVVLAAAIKREAP